MIVFPNCKINLGLRIVGRRTDGFHDLETVMIPAGGLCEALEVIRADEDSCAFSASGIPVDGPAEQNLCVRAYQLMRERYGIGGVKMHLHKHIPFGAGLGGGSADGAFALRAIADVFGLSPDDGELESLAARLGSDTAFFVGNHPALATGRGEILTPIEIDLSGIHLLIVKPPFAVSTAEAYRHVTPAAAEKPLTQILSAPVATWRETLKNDFEPSLFVRYPELAWIKATLYEAGAFYASLSGSGSAVYGLFEAEPQAGLFPGDWFVHLEKML